MGGNFFAFPPPPPPPQQAVDTQHLPAGNTFSRGRGDQRWGRGPRNRGKGNTYRGSRDGSQQFGGNTHNHAVNNANQHGGPSYPLPNYPPVQHPQYPPEPPSGYSNSPSPYYPIVGQPVPRQTPPYPCSSPGYYAQAQRHQPYQPQPSVPHVDHRYASPLVAMGPPIRLGFGEQQGMDPRQHPSSHQYRGKSAMDYHLHDSLPPSRGSPSYRARGGGHPSPDQRGRGRVRGRGSFNRKGNLDAPTPSHAPSRKTQVAPAVPSFGYPLPLKPPTPNVEDKKLGKKKRRRLNQLGLTPKTDEYISSSEEEDADEELRLAVAAGTTGTPDQLLAFKYKGQTSTLQSSSDIASWIEERRKRFPTAARKAENDARLEKTRQEHEQQREEKKQAFEAEKLFKRQLKTLENDKQAATEKAKLKVEKLRRKLEKEERRIAKAEAESLRRNAPEAEDGSAHAKKRKRSQGIPNSESVDQSADLAKKKPIGTLEAVKDLDTDQISGRVTTPAPVSEAFDDNLATLERSSNNVSATLVPGPLTPTSQPSAPEQEAEPKSAEGHLKDPTQPPRGNRDAAEADPLAKGGEFNHNISSTPSNMSNYSEDTLDDEDDETSSNGSPSSSNSDDGEPEAVSSRHSGPQKIAAPRRNDKQGKAICRDFFRTGRCRRGERCRWRHALPDRKQKMAADTTVSRPERKSLHQR
ncbi:MAG: hypothetical protein Q9184_003327, partial [Pyrenodesmia sp. 2 TL-2023]